MPLFSCGFTDKNSVTNYGILMHPKVPGSAMDENAAIIYYCSSLPEDCDENNS